MHRPNFRELEFVRPKTIQDRQCRSTFFHDSALGVDRRWQIIGTAIVGPAVYVNSINNSGKLYGRVVTSRDSQHPYGEGFSFSASEGLQWIPQFNGTNAEFSVANNLGLLAGRTRGGVGHEAFLFDGSNFFELELNPGYPLTQVSALSDNAIAVGGHSNNAGYWHPDGSVTVYENPIGYLGYAHFTAINPSGLLAGGDVSHPNSDGTDWNSRAFVIVDDEMRLLPGFGSELEGSHVASINNRGEIVGTCSEQTTPTRACYWRNKTAFPVQFTLPPNWVFANPLGIGASGTIVGWGQYSTIAGGLSYRAVLFQNGRPIDLNGSPLLIGTPPGIRWERVDGINKSESIALQGIELSTGRFVVGVAAKSPAAASYQTTWQ